MVGTSRQTITRLLTIESDAQTITPRLAALMGVLGVGVTLQVRAQPQQGQKDAAADTTPAASL